MDIDESKRNAALAAGATSVVDGRAADVTAAIIAAAGGPVLYALDFVNNSATAKTAFDSLAKGGKLILVGVAGGELELSLAGMIFTARDVAGTQTGSLQDLRDVVELARSGKLRPIPVECMPMDRANDALQKLDAGQATGRIVLEAADPV